MLRRLRQKFVALIMAILAIVLTAVCVIVCFLSWQSSTTEVYQTLEQSIDIASEDDFEGHAYGMRRAGSIPDVPMGRHRNAYKINAPVAVYLLQDSKLYALEASTGWIDEETLNSILETVDDSGDGLNRIGSENLIYLKQPTPNGTFVAFIGSEMADGWQTLAIWLAMIELIVLIIFFFISIAFSKWALKPVEEAWKTQKQFMSDASHELKTPLSIIMANTSILLEEDSDQAERPWLESTSNAASGMKELLDEMLEIASLDEQVDRSDALNPLERKDVSDLEEIDISRLMERSVLGFESRSFEQGFDLNADIEPDIIIRTDQDDVQRVVDILLDNACKYVNGNGSVDVNLGKKTSPDRAIITIGNTGSKIPEDKLEHIFDRFYRTDKARTSGEGHGLGLSIAKTIVDKMDWTIEVESTEERTTFVLTIS